MRHPAAPEGCPSRGEQQHPHLTAAGRAHPALIKPGIIRNPVLQRTCCLAAKSHPYSPAQGDPMVLHALLKGGCWNTRAHGRLQILKGRAADHAATSAGPRCTFSTFFSWCLHPRQEQEAEKAPEEMEEYPETWAQRRGRLLGVLSVARGAQQQGLVAAPYLRIRRGSAEAQLYYW